MAQAAFKKTDENKRLVEHLAGLGLTQQQIALIVGCSDKTLRKYFIAELKMGDAAATAKVAESLFRKALKGDVTSCIFWMKARAKWSDRPPSEGGSNNTTIVIKGGLPE